MFSSDQTGLLAQLIKDGRLVVQQILWRVVFLLPSSVQYQDTIVLYDRVEPVRDRLEGRKEESNIEKNEYISFSVCYND